MAFQIGGHPAFAVPFAGGEYSDYRIEFPKKVTAERHLLTEAGTYSGETQSVLQNTNQLKLEKQLFLEDAIVFKNFPLRSASLIHAETGAGLRVDFEGFHHLGLWAAKDADFVSTIIVCSHAKWSTTGHTRGNEANQWYIFYWATGVLSTL